MKYFDLERSTTAIGLAYSPGVVRFVEEFPGQIDYVEVPYEQLRHTPNVALLQEQIPLVLHCASMSVAGDAPPSESTLNEIQYWAERTRTPWIGEHLAYMSAKPILTAADQLADQPVAADEGAPVSLHYTVCPQLDQKTLDRAIGNVRSLQKRFSTPILLENSPQYFEIPRSTMSLMDFIRGFFAGTENGLLLDLTHFVVSSRNTGYDYHKEIQTLPLERVVEIHVSGFSVQSGVAWDDHAIPATLEVFELLDVVLERARPRAITFEYNWDTNFSQQILLNHIQRVRDKIAAHQKTGDYVSV